jgi:hypothetical protein
VRRLGCLVGAAAVLAVPGTAHAANTYVDATRPDNSGDCFTPATACETFTGPGGAVAKAGPNDTIFAVDPATQTTYNDTINLFPGKSLVALSPDPTETIIDNGAAASPAVTVSGTGTGQVRGFTIRSDHRAIEIHRPATVRDNVFDDPGPLTTTVKNDMEIGPGAGSPLITDNKFVDPAPTTSENQIAIRTTSSGSPTISDNEFDDFLEAVLAGGSETSSPNITGNDIAGTRVAVNAGVAIGVITGTPTITGNFIHDPFFAMPNDFVFGIGINQIGVGAAGATLKRNRVVGHRWGVDVQDTAQPVTLESDVIAKSVAAGLRTSDSGGDDPGVGDVTASNVTITDTTDPALGNEILATNAAVVLGSSIVGDKGVELQGTGMCTSSFSRGPATGNCQPFATSADPLFVDPSANDYHLQASSSMIDAGSPAAPLLGATDVDGNPRAIDGDGDCTARRDIGADERLVAPNPACTPPPGGGDGDGDAVSNEFSFGKVKKNRKRGTAKLTVEVLAAGELDLDKTKKVKGATKVLPTAGEVKLPIKPKGKAKRKLKGGGRAKVRAEVTFTPDGGEPNTQSKRVKLVKRR